MLLFLNYLNFFTQFTLTNAQFGTEFRNGYIVLVSAKFNKYTKKKHF